MGKGLTGEQLAQYRQDGYVIVPNLFSAAECGEVVEQMMDLQAGRKLLAGFEPRAADNWNRTHNQHLYDPLALELMLDERLRAPLSDCLEDDVDGVQTMYFWKGSEQRRHQDQYYLPGCMSAWIAFVDVGPENGTIHVQPGSQQHRLWQRSDFVAADGQALPTFGEHYNDRIDEQFAANALPEVPVCAQAGAVVFFHGALIHRGGPIGQPGAFRHVMACHYVPYHFTGWPYADWPRISFDRERRVQTS